MRHGPYDFPERTMYNDCYKSNLNPYGCECDQLGRLRPRSMVQLTGAQLGQVGPVGSTAIGMAIGAAYGAAIGAVAGGKGRRGKAALYGAATGAAINLVTNMLGLVAFSNE